MAPDINSMPSSPRHDRQQLSSPTSNTASQRVSQQLPSPSAIPTSASLPYAQRSPVMSSNEFSAEPLRHPRPLTVAELYLECEKEQEAVVNRLTRELTALRAQSASVASNASHSSNSTSASLLPVDISDPNPAHQLTGATHPTPARRHRSSSSLSTRSIPNTSSTSLPVATSGTTNTTSQATSGSTTITTQGSVSQASADRAAAAGSSTSRTPSISASGASTPARQSLDISRHTQPSGSYTLPHRPSLSRDPSYGSHTTSSTAAQHGTPIPPAAGSAPLSPTQHITTPHYADTAAYRSELETVKAENEALRQRVRALEQALRSRRRDSSNSDAARPSRARDNSGPLAVSPASMATSPPDARASFGGASVAAWAADGGVGGVAPPRERSESQSTTASSRRGLPAEDDVRLGESAGSIGIGRGV